MRALWKAPASGLALRLSSLISLLFCCLPATVIRAESSEGEARLASARVVEVTPGKIVTASILIANRSEAAAAFEEAFVLPSGWQRISPPASPLVLAPDGQQLRLIAFAVPATSRAGSVDLQYVLTNSRTQSPLAAVTVTVVVLPVVKLELVREDETDMIVAGENYEARLRLINRGNGRLKVAIEAVTAPAALVRLEPAEIWLEPASSAPVRAFIQSDVLLEKPLTQVINFKATAVGHDGVSVTAPQSVLVNVIPRITGDRDPYIRLPAQLRFTAASEDGRSGGQVEFSGAGYLDEGRKHLLEFLFRGPSLEGKSLYGLRDELRVSYYGSKLDVHLGDRNYALSPLTQRFNYGRGAEVAFHSGATSAGAFYMQTLEQARELQTAGSYIRHVFSPKLSLQANALYKSGSGMEQHTGPLGIFSLQPHFNFGPRLDLDIEFGMSTAGSGAASQAHRVEARGQLFEEFTYAIERVHAGDSFFGYYHGTETTQTAVTFPIYGPLRGKGSFNQDKREATMDLGDERRLPVGVSATRQTAYRPGVQLHVSARTDLSLEYQNIERHAALQAGPQDSVEHSARLGIGHSRGQFSLQTFAEFGTMEKTGAGALSAQAGSETVERYSAFLSYRPSSRQSYSIFGTTGSATTLDVIERSETLGASAQWNLSSRLSASVNYARNAYDSRMARVQDTATGTVSYTLPNRNVIGLQGRWIKDSSTREKGKSVMVSYTIPFGLRASRKKSGGTIRGKIFHLEGSTAAPMSRVVVTANGITAVTDRNGNFVFPALKPGLYQVNVEQRSLGVDRVTVEPVPVSIEIARGGTVELSIGVVRSARISGKIALFKSTQSPLALAFRTEAEPAFAPLGGFAGGLVELSNGRQVLRQVTDRDGEVTFDHLRPGKWTLRVYQNNVPDLHVVETPEMELELTAGESRDASVRILPKIRRIQFIDGGTIAPPAPR